MNIRSYRIFSIAIFDLVLSMIGMVLIFLIAKQYHFKSLETWRFVFAGIIVAIPVGIVFHIIFGINTQLNYNLGLSGPPKR